MNERKNKILVAIDFGAESMNALEHSYALARVFDAELLLLYVLESSGVLGKLRSPEEYEKKIIDTAREKFDELEELAKSTEDKSQIKTSFLIQKGKPYQRIIETAYEYSVLLIVIGKNNATETTPRRRFAGSNSLNVVREAPCPVITIKSKAREPGKFHNILLPLDFTKQTKKQVQKAIEIGGYFGARINILSILRKDNKVIQLLKQVQLKQIKNAVQKQGIQCYTDFVFARDGVVADIVLQHSKRINADLIIIMTQQKKKFVHYYIGSTAQALISESTIPVISIIPIAEFKPGMVTSLVDPMGLIQTHKKADSGES